MYSQKGVNEKLDTLLLVEMDCNVYVTIPVTFTLMNKDFRKPYLSKV